MNEAIQEIDPDVVVLAADPRYAVSEMLGDRRDGAVYVHTERIRWAVKVAQVTGRPLLLRGPAGSGKSSLAPFVARFLKRRFYSATVQSRTQARDLMYEFDALRRLADAQANESRARIMHHYVEPRALWWAFDPVSAAIRGAAEDLPAEIVPAADPGVGPTGANAVVLIDEIDKADPDVPNSLLEALGSRQFTISETGFTIKAETRNPLILITTNEERDLPAAFLRRCVILFLPEHQKEDLVRIARAHFGNAAADLYALIADEVLRLRKELPTGCRPPSTAEFLDAIRACVSLELSPRENPKGWNFIFEFTLLKTPKAPLAVPVT